MSTVIVSRRSAAAALTLAALGGASTAAAAALPTTDASDPVFAQIKLHKALKTRVDTHPSENDCPSFDAAVCEEDAAIHALGDMTPTTIAGAAAQLLYMAEVEGTYPDNGSPGRQTMLTVARALAAGLPA